MRLVDMERRGEAFDPQIVIGIRESYGEHLTRTRVIPLTRTETIGMLLPT